MASRSINRVILLGNLTRDPELKYTPAGTAVCTFSIATNRSWTTQDGQTKEEVQYHRIVSWQKLAELCGKLLQKGRKVYVEGRITYRNYTSKEGQQRSVTEIVLDDFIVFSDGKRIGTAESHIAESPTTMTEPSMAMGSEQPSQQQESSDHTPVQDGGKQDVNPDDIPF